MAGLPTPIKPSLPTRRHPFPGFGWRRTMDIVSSGSYMAMGAFAVGSDITGGGVPTTPNLPPNDNQIYGIQNGQWINITQSITTIAQTIVDSLTQAPAKGVTDGSDAKAGEVGEVITTNGIITLTTEPDDSGNYSVIGTLNFTPGDWEIFSTYWMDMSTVAPTPDPNALMGAWEVLLNSSIPGASTDPTQPSEEAAWNGISGIGWLPWQTGGSIGPIRINTGGPFSVDLRVIVWDGNVGGQVATCYYAISARRMR